MRQAIVVPGKYGMADLILSLKDSEIKVESIPVHMHQGHTESQQPKDKNETPTVMAHMEQINEITTIPLPTEKEWKQATSEDHDLGYIKRIYLFQKRHLFTLNN